MMDFARSHNTAESQCPSCGHKVEAALSVNGQRAPKEGDASICIECGVLAIYTAEQTLRAATKEEREKWATNPDVIEAQLLIASLSKP